MWNTIKKTVQNFFHKTVNSLEAGLLALAKSIADNGGDVLIAAALAAVTAAETTGGKGEDKFKAAQAAVIASLRAKGIPVVKNAVNGAIEAAVASMKSDA